MIIQEAVRFVESMFFWVNGASNFDLVYIKTKRKTVNVFHYDCIEKERRENAKR